MYKNLNRSNIDHLLYQVAKDYKKHNRNNPNIEVILVGGASILLSYNFRDETTDLDGIFQTSPSLKESIIRVAEENELPFEWMNSDFRKTESFSPHIVQYSKFYKQFCNCMQVRLVEDEYLIAMKLKSFREYKHDKSDIVGIMMEQKQKNKNISLEDIRIAYKQLYNENLSEDREIYIDKIIHTNDLEGLFYDEKEREMKNKEILLKVEQDYPNALNETNVKSFLEHFAENMPKTEQQVKTPNFVSKIPDEKDLIEVDYLAQTKAKNANPSNKTDDEDQDDERNDAVEEQTVEDCNDIDEPTPGEE